MTLMVSVTMKWLSRSIMLIQDMIFMSMPMMFVMGMMAIMCVAILIMMMVIITFMSMMKMTNVLVVDDDDICDVDAHDEDEDDNDNTCPWFGFSGTIWMQQILLLIEAEGDVTSISKAEKNGDLVPWIEVKGSREAYIKAPSPRLTVTHLPSEFLPTALSRKKGKVRWCLEK